MNEVAKRVHLHLFYSWLHSGRQGSAIARDAGLRYNELSISHLRKLVQTL